MNEKSIFAAALDIADTAKRAAYLDQACGNDAGLRRHLDELLTAQEKLGSFLDQPLSLSPPTADYQPITERPGTVIGPYKLLQQIGEGGFGVVYMAEQEKPVRRMVALKIIKPGMDTAQVIARFESERQALAIMAHPNVAMVLDAGTTESGRPYFVMELVKGVPITEFCDKNHMPTTARLKIFLDVCHAIQHAHHKGIIHRDIKSSNVMVTLHDGVPVVKVIDFGVAKATAQRLTEKTLFTAYGQMVGTPAYMSPEQAEMSGLDIDTRSDIYSLGVLLYELLTGTTPLDSKKLRTAGYIEMQRLIREEEAPRPSTRLSSLGGEATVLAGNRGTDPKRLMLLLSGDLDWIVMKALEKDRNRRYSSPGSFAADIGRYLHGDAIEAHPPTARYRLQKFYGRNRAGVYVVAVILILLGAGLFGTGKGMFRAHQAERRARDDEALARDSEQLAEHRLIEIGLERDVAVKAQAKADLNAQMFKSAAALAESQRLAANSTAVRSTNPGQALLLAIAGAEKTPIRSASTNNALLAALRDSREERTIYAPPFQTPDGATGRTEFLALKVTPDGTRAVVVPKRNHMASGDFYLARANDDSAQVYDLTTGKVTASMKLAGLRFTTMAISPDSTLLAAGTDQGAIVGYAGGKTVAYTDATVRLWDLRTGKEVRVLKGHTDRVSSICFDGKGERLLTASWDKTARIWDIATGKTIHVLEDGKMSLASADFSPDGRRVLTNGTYQLRQGSGRHENIRNYTGQTVPAGEILVDPEAGRDDSIRSMVSLNGGSVGGNEVAVPILWDGTTGKRIAVLSDQVKKSRGSDHLTAAGFSADGTRVLTAGNNDVEIWNAADGVPVTSVAKIKDSLVLFKDGDRIFHVGLNAPVVFGEGTGLPIWQTDADKRDWCRAPTARHQDGFVLDLSATTQPLVAESSQDSVAIREMATGKLIAELRGHEDKVSAAGFLPGGKKIVTASHDGTLRVWNLEAKHDPVIEMKDSRGRSFETGFLVAGGRQVLRAPERDDFSRYAGNYAAFWDAATGAYVADAFDAASLATSPLHKELLGDLGDVSISPDGERLATVHLDGNPCANSKDEPKTSPIYTPVRVWDTRTGKLLFALKGFRRSVATARFSSDGTRLLTFADGNYHYTLLRDGKKFGSGNDTSNWARVDIWDARTGEHLRSIVSEAQGGGAFAVWSPDGKRVLTNTQCERNVPANVFDADTGNRLHRLTDTGDSMDSAAFSPDGKLIVGYRTRYLNNQIFAEIWDATTGEKRFTLKGHTGNIKSAIFSPDSRSILTTAADGTARIWDAATGEQRRVLRAHRNVVRTGRFSPDGKWVVTASADGTARIWEAETGLEWMTLPASQGEMASAEFTPDSQRVLTIASSNVASIWPLDPLPLAISRKPRELTTDELGRFGIEEK